ncbi:hypothetical protein [Paracoccus sp. (in: a-proteobacteria)]|uniref:hypothetical protein n=1 Tax=Paracoccus sp. TaxID=267 RepID=UPI002AFDD0FA|nr:hypothetical protein [Paracoccus sp. (in: a-proteobacteria)]
MDQIFQASLTRAAELLNEAAASLQEAAEAAAGHVNIAHGGTEYARICPPRPGCDRGLPHPSD